MADGNGRRDVWSHRLTVGGLILTAVSGGLNITVLAWVGKPIPESLSFIAGTAVGALASTLAALMQRPEKGES